MICALSCSPGMTVAQRAYTNHGFMTVPHFLDNNFVKKGKADLKFLDKWLRRYGCGLIQYAIAPDLMLEEALELKDRWPDIKWIWPLHSMDEDISEFDWVAFPHDKPRRDFTLQKFMKLTENKKKWYLGYFAGTDPSMLLYFDGFDTTIPSFYAMNNKMWHSWKKSESVSGLMFNYHELIEFNTISLKKELRRLFFSKNTGKLTDFVESSINSKSLRTKP